MKRSFGILSAAIYIATAASPAVAHHSHPFFYDWCKSVTIEGRVDSVQWKDPHTIIVVRLDDGTLYTVDWAGLRGLTNNRILGPAQEALVFGARVSVTGAPIRTLAEIRAHFADYTTPVNPRTIDPRLIRRLGGDFSWTQFPESYGGNCKGK